MEKKYRDASWIMVFALFLYHTFIYLVVFLIETTIVEKNSSSKDSLSLVGDLVYLFLNNGFLVLLSSKLLLRGTNFLAKNISPNYYEEFGENFSRIIFVFVDITIFVLMIFSLKPQIHNSLRESDVGLNEMVAWVITALDICIELSINKGDKPRHKIERSKICKIIICCIIYIAIMAVFIFIPYNKQRYIMVAIVLLVVGSGLLKLYEKKAKKNQ